MRIKDIPQENRPRERLKANGAETLSNSELLAILLQKGTKTENVIDMSNRLLSKFSIDNLSECSLTELKSIPGIGEAKAMQIIALFELSKRIKGGTICEKVVNNSEDVAKYYMEKLRDKKKEYFIAVFLDSKNKIIKDEVISVGTLNSSLVHPREVFKEAIKNSANALILVHNHPSGNCEPSGEDELITEKLIEAGNIMQIKVLDHIVVAGKALRALLENEKVYVDTNVLVDYCLLRKGKFNLDYEFAFDFFRRGIDCEFYLVISDWTEEEALKYVEQKKIDELFEHISSKLIKIKMSDKQKKEAYRISRTNWHDARHAIMARDENCFKMATKDGDFHAFSHIVDSAYPQSI